MDDNPLESFRNLSAPRMVIARDRLIEDPAFETLDELNAILDGIRSLCVSRETQAYCGGSSGGCALDPGDLRHGVVKYASDFLSAATPWEGCRTSWLQGRRAAAVGTCSAFGGTRESIYLYGRRYCGNVSDVKNTFNLWWWRA